MVDQIEMIKKANTIPPNYCWKGKTKMTKRGNIKKRVEKIKDRERKDQKVKK